MFNNEELEKMAKGLVILVMLGCIVGFIAEIRVLIWIVSTF